MLNKLITVTLFTLLSFNVMADPEPKLRVGIETLRNVTIQVRAGEDNLKLEDVSVNDCNCTMSSVVQVGGVKKILPVMLNEEDVAVIQALSDCEVLLLDVTSNSKKLSYEINTVEI